MEEIPRLRLMLDYCYATRSLCERVQCYCSYAFQVQGERHLLDQGDLGYFLMRSLKTDPPGCVWELQPHGHFPFLEILFRK